MSPSLHVVQPPRRNDSIPWNRSVDGNLVPAAERPQRIDAIASGLRRAGAESAESPVDEQALERALRAVHRGDYLAFLAQSSAALDSDDYRFYDEWSAPGVDADTPVFAGAFELAVSGARAAIGAAQLIADGAEQAYALCRPPGHHAGPAWLGGYCFLNNAALAAHTLRERHVQPVAIIDLDFHLGDGSSAICAAMPGVRYVSLHASPRRYFPWKDVRPGPSDTWISYDDPPTEERFVGDVEAALETLDKSGCEAFVVSIGYDGVRGDPHGGWRFAPAVFAAIGAALAQCPQPLCLVQEGGYALDQLEECAFCLGVGLQSTNTTPGDDAVRTAPGLQRLRHRLDVLDSEIVDRLGERFAICRTIGSLKREHGIPMMQERRVDAVRSHYAERGAAVGLPGDFVGAFFDLLIQSTCRVEAEIIAERAGTGPSEDPTFG